MKKLITCSVLALTAGSFADTYVVEAHSMTFEPDVVTVQPGDIIRWEYVTGYPHDVTSGMKCTDDGYLYLDIPSGGSVEWTVPEDAPSEIPYFCTLHCGSGMTGTINVEGDSEEGRMSIGIVDISSCSVEYYEGDGTASITIDGSIDAGGFASFAWGVEIEDGDIEVTVDSFGDVYLHNASTGTSSPCPPGAYPLLNGQKYMFHGSAGCWFNLEWPEQGDEEGMGMSISGFNTSIHSSSSDGDNISFRAPGFGIMLIALTAEEDMQVRMAVIANVTSTSLTLPASGEEADVEIPAGKHIIELNGDGLGMGMLLMQMGDGDGGGLPEDVNGDGVVNVTDLLAVIAAWGATAP